VSTNPGSSIPGPGTTSIMRKGRMTRSSTSSFDSLSMGVGASFFTFIIAHTTSVKTVACTMSPAVDGHPVGVAMRGPRTRLTRRNVSGFAMMKKVKPEMREVMNFSCCFRPLHPQPQSLKRPMISFIILTQKN